MKIFLSVANLVMAIVWLAWTVNVPLWGASRRLLVPRRYKFRRRRGGTPYSRTISVEAAYITRFVTMKTFLPAILSLTLLATPTLAQNRPFRVTVVRLPEPNPYGQDGGGISLDMKYKLAPSMTLSFYYEGVSREGVNTVGGGVIESRSDPRTPSRFAGFSGVGFSLRQAIGKQLWVGAGLGDYITQFDGSGNRSTRSLGGKVFVGAGQGMLFTELAVTNSGILKNTQFSLSLGVRL